MGYKPKHGVTKGKRSSFQLGSGWGRASLLRSYGGVTSHRRRGLF